MPSRWRIPCRGTRSDSDSGQAVFAGRAEDAGQVRDAPTDLSSLSPRPNDVHLSFDCSEAFGRERHQAAVILERERLKAVVVQPVNHPVDREAAGVAQARGTFEDDDVGADERPAGAVDNGRLIALD